MRDKQKTAVEREIYFDVVARFNPAFAEIDSIYISIWAQVAPTLCRNNNSRANWNFAMGFFLYVRFGKKILTVTD
jgi:hypothetical protein